jgi:hypothetical protein
MRWRVVIGAALVAGALVVSPVFGKEPEKHGWWNRAAAPAPDVPADALLVQGSTPGPFPAPADTFYEAVAALQFALAADESVGDLTLTFAQPVPPGIAVTACKLLGTFTPAQNGTWTDRPTFDCGVSVPGALAADRATMTWAGLGGFVTDEGMGLVLVPGGPVRAVFAKPGVDALAVEDGGGGSDGGDDPGPALAPPDPAPFVDAPPPDSPGAFSAGGSFTPSVAPIDGPAVAMPAVPSGAALSSGPSGAQSVPSVPVAKTSGLSRGRDRLFALLQLAVLAGGVALLEDDRRKRGSDRARGLGRFVRDRQGPAPRL